ILTFRRNAEAISGNVFANSCPLKKLRRTSAHPGELTTATARAAKTTTVLTIAIATARASPRTRTPPRIREPRPGISSLLEDGDADDLREPGRVDLLQRPVRLQVLQRLVDAADEGIALLEDHPDVL